MKPRYSFRGVVMNKAPAARAASAVTAAATPAIAKASQKVRVGREVAGRGGKGVTVITGIALAESELQQLATQLKKSCGAGGAVRGATIEIQGDHRDRLVAELIRLGYAPKRSGG